MCLNWGCIPTKAMLRSAELFEAAQHGAEYGVLADNVRLDYAAVLKRKDAVVKSLTDGVGQLLKANGVTVFNGHARFTGANQAGCCRRRRLAARQRRPAVQRARRRQRPADGAGRRQAGHHCHRFAARRAADPGRRPARRDQLGWRLHAEGGPEAHRHHRRRRGRHRVGDDVRRLRLRGDARRAPADAAAARGRGHGPHPGALVPEARHQGLDRVDRREDRQARLGPARDHHRQGRQERAGRRRRQRVDRRLASTERDRHRSRSRPASRPTSAATSRSTSVRRPASKTSSPLATWWVASSSRTSPRTRGWSPRA